MIAPLFIPFMWGRSMAGIKLFMVEATGIVVEEVCLWPPSGAPPCPGGSYKGAPCCARMELRRVVGIGPGEHPPFSPYMEQKKAWDSLKYCSTCGLAANEDWHGSSSMGHLWRRPDRPDELERKPDAFGPGAIWKAKWLGDLPRIVWHWDNWPETEFPISIMTPGGVWMPQSRASNCTMPEDRLHRCWCLHGTMPDTLTADKTPEPGGSTCAAGAGSILTNGWHGFLRNGELVEA